MSKIYDRVDLFWTFQGDAYVGSDGDLMDTSHDPLRSLLQEVKTRTKSDQGDWSINPDLGATPSDFVGKMNVKATAEAFKSRIIAACARHGFVNTSDITIRYAPIDRDKIMFRVTIEVAETPENQGTESVSITFVYDYTENNVLYVG